MSTIARKDIPCTQLVDGVYLLNEFDGTNCYLVTGSERALLIDCGTGFCDMRGKVEELTDKPIVVAATHGHGDHFGGRGQFSEIFVHKDDTGRFNLFQGGMLFRRLFVTFNAPVRAHGFSPRDVTKPEYKTKILPMEDGFVFDLGGKTVSVKHTPGHSRGSVAFVDETDKIVFSGDNVCDALWMQLPGATSLEEWLPSAEWLLEQSKTYRIFWGHRVPELTTEYIGEVISWGKEIVASTKRNTLLYRVKQYPDRPDGIIYRTDRVLK